MSEDWSAVAAEVEGALRSIGDMSQPDGFPVALRRMSAGDPYNPDAGTTPTYTDFVALDEKREVRDASGMLVGQTVRTITVNATTGVTPTERDTIAIGIKAADAGDASPWEEILAVRTLAPAGVAVYHEMDIAI